MPASSETSEVPGVRVRVRIRVGVRIRVRVRVRVRVRGGDLLEVVAVDDHRRWSNGLDALVAVCAALGPRILDDAGVRRVGAHVAKDVRHRRAGRREVGQRVHEQVVRLRDVHILLRYGAPG